MSTPQLEPPFLHTLRRLRRAFVQRRVIHGLVRAMWLGLLVPTLTLGGVLFLDWDVAWYQWVVPMLLAGALSVMWSMRPLGLRHIVRRLDTELDFRAQLLTAFDLSRTASQTGHQQNPVAQSLFGETISVLSTIRRRVRTVGTGLWLEMQALIAVSAVLSAFLMLDALTIRVPQAGIAALPPPWEEPSAEEVLLPTPELRPPPPQQVNQEAPTEQEIQQALESLADALRDQAATRSIAESLDQGDLEGAAQDLQRLADQLGDLSDEARGQLRDSIGQAGNEIGNSVPDLSEPLRDGQRSLGNNDLNGAGQALEDLAEALESLGEGGDGESEEELAQNPQEEGEGEGEASSDPADEGEEGQAPGENQEDAPPAPNEEPAGEGGEGEGEGGETPLDPPSEDERLALESEPLEIESDLDNIEDRVLQPAELDATSDQRTQDSPFARQSSSLATDLGPDPLSYPWEKRDIVRRYFTPQ